ncbi:MAG: ubiquinol-cytochrome c reductase iron-sulfur subunit [Actinomycetales bacterium]
MTTADHPRAVALTGDAEHLVASRRTFLIGACGLITAGLGTALLADDAEAATGIKRRANGQVDVTVAKVPALAKVGGAALLGNVKGVPTAVVRTGQNTYQALNLRCTHQGVPVALRNGQWSCPAHGSAFAIDGSVTGGPAETSLATVKSALNKGVLTVG